MFIRRARDKVVLQVRRPVHENGRGRQHVTGSSINNSRPAPRWPMTSSCRFRCADWQSATSRRPVVGDATLHRGVLSQLPVSLPSGVMTSRTVWNKPKCSIAVPRRLSTHSNVVTTDYGWIDSGDTDLADESNKENCLVEKPREEDRDFASGGRQRSQSSGETFEVDVASPWKSPDSSSSMDVDDSYVDMGPYNNLEMVAPNVGRLTRFQCRAEGPSVMPQVRRQRLPLGTIDEATETINSSDSSSLTGGNPADEPEGESDAVRPEPEMVTTENFYELPPFSGASTVVDDLDVRSLTDPNDVADGDVSVRQRCAGWRFSSSRPRLTVTEFCRRRRDTEAKKTQRSASATDDGVSVNDSIVSLGPSTKRRRTSLKVLCIPRYICYKIVQKVQKKR